MRWDEKSKEGRKRELGSVAEILEATVVGLALPQLTGSSRSH